MNMTTSSVVLSNRVRIDLDQRTVWRGTHAIYLPSRSWAILAYLLQHPNQVIPSDALLAVGWVGEPGHTHADLYRHIHRIRQTLERDPRRPQRLITRREMGYELVVPEPVRRGD